MGTFDIDMDLRTAMDAAMKAMEEYTGLKVTVFYAPRRPFRISPLRMLVARVLTLGCT
jgi:hypothetical protein